MHSIFICEPASSHTRTFTEYLEAKDFAVQFISESRRAIEDIVTRMPDAALLDADLPKALGYEVCKAVRPHYKGPVLIKGFNSDEASQLLAFERGANDYILMPVSPALLAARICAHLYRSCGTASKSESETSTSALSAGIASYLSTMAMGMGENQTSDMMALFNANMSAYSSGGMSAMNIMA